VKTIKIWLPIFIFFLVLLGIFLSRYIVQEAEIDKPRIVLGKTKIEFNGGEAIGVQVDRVIRDIAWKGSDWDNRTPPDRVPKKPKELVPYMEGARTAELVKYAKAKVMPLTPGKAKLLNGCYYGADGQGRYLFKIDPSKVAYITTVKQGEYLIMPDTHGFNAVAEQAYLNRKNIYTVIACMDMADKARAALYLAQNGLNIYAPCDRFANELINYKKRYGLKTEILPSAPVKNTWTGAVIGNQPLTIYLDEPIVIQWTDKKGYPDQYCDTPFRYFNQLQKAYNLKLKVIKVYANSGEASKVVDAARSRQAKVIGIRVFNKADYEPVKKWLAEDKTRRAVLLHSVAYEEGAKLFTKFRRQTTFGDLCPEIKLTKL